MEYCFCFVESSVLCGAHYTAFHPCVAFNILYDNLRYRADYSTLKGQHHPESYDTQFIPMLLTGGGIFGSIGVTAISDGSC